jgi:hypothetical protein
MILLNNFPMVLLALSIAGLLQSGGEDPDKIVELTERGGKLVFLEKREEKAKAVTIVVGQTIRWKNLDHRPHRLVSVRKVDGKPIFDTGTIEPNAHKDLKVDIEIYRKAGGRPANYVVVKYHSLNRSDDVAELLILSAARR